jgi:hypothetical protein
MQGFSLISEMEPVGLPGQSWFAREGRPGFAPLYFSRRANDMVMQVEFHNFFVSA